VCGKSKKGIHNPINYIISLILHPLIDSSQCFLKKNEVLWDTKYKEDYEVTCNKLFPTMYQVLFGEEAPCLSPEGQNIVKQYRDWYMTPIGVYTKILCNTKPPHWLPHLVPDSLLLQEISYKTYVNGVAASLHRNKKGLFSS
jgi:hypothetical protein